MDPIKFHSQMMKAYEAGQSQISLDSIVNGYALEVLVKFQANPQKKMEIVKCVKALNDAEKCEVAVKLRSFFNTGISGFEYKVKNEGENLTITVEKIDQNLSTFDDQSYGYFGRR